MFFRLFIVLNEKWEALSWRQVKLEIASVMSGEKNNCILCPLVSSYLFGKPLIDICSFLPESKLSGFWQLILDEKKQIFTSEKFLQSASEEGKLSDIMYPATV